MCINTSLGKTEREEKKIPNQVIVLSPSSSRRTSFFRQTFSSFVQKALFLFSVSSSLGVWLCLNVSLAFIECELVVNHSALSKALKAKNAATF